jgi:hypothetical protein
MKAAVKLNRNERAEAVMTLRQAVSQLTLRALRLGASSTEILDAVGRGIDTAAEINQKNGPRIVR